MVHDLAFFDFPDCYGDLEKFYYRVNLWIIRSFRHEVVVPSEFVKADLVSRVGINRERINVISPYSNFDGCSEGFERSGSCSVSNGKYFLSVSNAHPRKNIEDTVAAFINSKLPSSGYSLVLVGSFERDLEEKIAERSDVVIRKNVSNQELLGLYSGAEALLLFSFSEGFGYPVVEAAAFGVPSLTSEVTSLAEFLPAGTPPDPALSVQKITNRLNRFLNDEAYRDNAILQAKEIALSYSMVKFNDNWKELIERAGKRVR